MKPFHRFYSENEQRLFGYLLHKSGDHQVAADLVQEAFARYLQHYRGHGENVPLLFAIGRNLFYDFARQQRRRCEFRENAVPEQGCGQEEICSAREDLTRVRKALRRLSEEERDILAMVVKGSLDYRQIAEIYGCSRANVKIRVHRARKNLKRRMQENKEE